MTISSERPKRRGRPKKSHTDREKMRETIEGTALNLFQSEGYGAVSMRRLATEIGCAPMTLYSYFENKIDILRALWFQVFQDLFDALEIEMEAASSDQEKLSILANGYVSYWIRHTEHYRMVFMAEGVSQPDVSSFINDKATAKRFGMFYMAVSRVSNTSSPEEIRERCDYLLAALHGIAHCHITMSGYPWNDPNKLVMRAVASIA